MKVPAMREADVGVFLLYQNEMNCLVQETMDGSRTSTVLLL